MPSIFYTSFAFYCINVFVRATIISIRLAIFNLSLTFRVEVIVTASGTAKVGQLRLDPLLLRSDVEHVLNLRKLLRMDLQAFLAIKPHTRVEIVVALHHHFYSD